MHIEYTLNTHWNIAKHAYMHGEIMESLAIRLSNIRLSKIRLSNIRLRNIRLSNIRLSNIRLSNIGLSNIWLSNIRLSNIRLRNISQSVPKLNVLKKLKNIWESIAKHGNIHIESILNIEYTLNYQNETFLINQEYEGIY